MILKILKLTFSITFLFLFSSCYQIRYIESKISPKSEEQMKRIWFEEIMSVEPTSSISYVSPYLPNQYLPLKPEIIDTFRGNSNVLFALSTGPFEMLGKEHTVLAKPIPSGYIITIAVSIHGEFESKGYAEISEFEFQILIDSINNISNDMLELLGTKTYLDSIELNECIIEYFRNKENNIETETSEDSYKFFFTEEQIKGICFERQIGSVLVNNIKKETLFFPYNLEPQGNPIPEAIALTERLFTLFNKLKWEQTY